MAQAAPLHGQLPMRLLTACIKLIIVNISWNQLMSAPVKALGPVKTCSLSCQRLAFTAGC